MSAVGARFRTKQQQVVVLYLKNALHSVSISHLGFDPLSKKTSFSITLKYRLSPQRGSVYISAVGARSRTKQQQVVVLYIKNTMHSVSISPLGVDPLSKKNSVSLTLRYRTSQQRRSVYISAVGARSRTKQHQVVVWYLKTPCILSASALLGLILSARKTPSASLSDIKHLLKEDLCKLMQSVLVQNQAK